MSSAATNPNGSEGTDTVPGRSVGSNHQDGRRGGSSFSTDESRYGIVQLLKRNGLTTGIRHANRGELLADVG